MVISTSRLSDTCSRTPSLHEHSRGAALGGHRWSGPSWGPASSCHPSTGAGVGAGCAGSPRAERGMCPCLHCSSFPGRPQIGVSLRLNWGVRELEANRQTKLYLVFPWSWPTIPKLQPVLGQSTGEGNPSLPLHRENHCIPQHFCLGRMY